MPRFSCSVFLASALAGSLLVATALAGPPDITIDDARIAGGRLLITGTSTVPHMKLRLDGREGPAFNVTSRPDRHFRFAAVYLPRDCVVSLQRVLPTGQLGPATEAVVAGCSPVAISPRGAWAASTAYEFTDLVTHEGASWIARHDVSGEEPGRSPAWQLFTLETAGQQAPAAPAGGLPAAGISPGTRLAAAAPVDPAAPPSGPAGGDLTGDYPNPSIRDGAVTTAKLDARAVTRDKIGLAAVTTNKIADAAVTAPKLADEAVTGTKILDGSVTSADVANGTLTDADIADNSITTFDLAENSVDSDEVLDFGLSNEDIGVLFAQVASDGTLSSSSGGAASSRLGTGQYVVDFGRNVSACAFLATQGEAGVGGATGAIIGVTDRSGSPESVFTTVRNADGTLIDRAFQLAVIC